MNYGISDAVKHRLFFFCSQSFYGSKQDRENDQQRNDQQDCEAARTACRLFLESVKVTHDVFVC